VGVAFRRFDAGVSHQFLDASNIHSIFEQVRGKRTASLERTRKTVASRQETGGILHSPRRASEGHQRMPVSGGLDYHAFHCAALSIMRAQTETATPISAALLLYAQRNRKSKVRIDSL